MKKNYVYYNLTLIIISSNDCDFPMLDLQWCHHYLINSFINYSRHIDPAANGNNTLNFPLQIFSCDEDEDPSRHPTDKVPHRLLYRNNVGMRSGIKGQQQQPSLKQSIKECATGTNESNDDVVSLALVVVFDSAEHGTSVWLCQGQVDACERQAIVGQQAAQCGTCRRQSTQHHLVDEHWFELEKQEEQGQTQIQ